MSEVDSNWGVGKLVHLYGHISSVDFGRTFLFSTPSSHVIVCQRRSSYVLLQHARIVTKLLQVSSCPWALPSAQKGLRSWEKGVSCSLGHVVCQQRVTWGMEITLVPWVNSRLETGFIFFQRDIVVFHDFTCSWKHVLKTSFIIVVITLFVLGQGSKILTAAYNIHMRTVSGSLHSDASVLHRLSYLVIYIHICIFLIRVTFRNICSSALG